MGMLWALSPRILHEPSEEVFDSLGFSIGDSSVPNAYMDCTNTMRHRVSNNDSIHWLS
jgi:hypothetical protein